MTFQEMFDELAEIPGGMDAEIVFVKDRKAIPALFSSLPGRDGVVPVLIPEPGEEPRKVPCDPFNNLANYNRIARSIDWSKKE